MNRRFWVRINGSMVRVSTRDRDWTHYDHQRAADGSWRSTTTSVEVFRDSVAISIYVAGVTRACRAYASTEHWTCPFEDLHALASDDGCKTPRWIQVGGASREQRIIA